MVFWKYSFRYRKSWEFPPNIPLFPEGNYGLITIKSLVSYGFPKVFLWFSNGLTIFNSYLMVKNMVSCRFSIKNGDFFHHHGLFWCRTSRCHAAGGALCRNGAAAGAAGASTELQAERLRKRSTWRRGKW